MSGGVLLTIVESAGKNAFRALCKVGSERWKSAADTTSSSVIVKKYNGKALQSGTAYRFRKESKTVNVKKAAAAAQTIKGLGKGKIFYFRICSYKTVSQKPVYSAGCDYGSFVSRHKPESGNAIF